MWFWNLPYRCNQEEPLFALGSWNSLIDRSCSERHVDFSTYKSLRQRLSLPRADGGEMPVGILAGNWPSAPLLSEIVGWPRAFWEMVWGGKNALAKQNQKSFPCYNLCDKCSRGLSSGTPRWWYWSRKYLVSELQQSMRDAGANLKVLMVYLRSHLSAAITNNLHPGTIMLHSFKLTRVTRDLLKQA